MSIVLIVTALFFTFCISVIIGAVVHRYWRDRYGGFELIWNCEDQTLKPLWEKALPIARIIFDKKGAEYGFWAPGDFLKVTTYMKVEVQRPWFDLGIRGLAAGQTIPGAKHVLVSLTVPLRDPATHKIIGATFMGVGAPWDGALIHEWNHLAYEYLYHKFDYNHAQPGDGLGASDGCWTPKHNVFIKDVRAELAKRFPL